MTVATKKVWAQKTAKFKEPLDSILTSIFAHIQSLLVGPSWRIYEHDDGLYIQKYNATTKQYESKFLFKSDGTADFSGSGVTGSVTLDDVGRK